MVDWTQTLNKHITIRQNFYRLQSGTIWPYESLPTFDETFLIFNDIAYLDNVTRDAIFQDLNSLHLIVRLYP